jgi:F-type H+-transporting ATPase subunit d
MSAKRVAASALDWAVISAKIPADNKAAFGALKMKVDKHLRNLSVHPESLGKIDFPMYKSKITVPGMVDTFEKSYSGLTIPYPGDQGKIAEIDAQAVAQKANFQKYLGESAVRIAAFQTELAKWESMQPVEEMTKEEALDAGLTQFVVDPDANSLFPHDQTWEEYVAKLETATPADFH